MLGASQYLVFIPNNILHLAKDSSTYPYIWTLVTSIFIEENLLFLAFFLALANYIVIMNRQSLEQAWDTKEFVKMICISGGLSSATHLLCRACIYGVTRNQEAYAQYRYSSINIIVMALLLGLCQ